MTERDLIELDLVKALADVLVVDHAERLLAN
jgi:hypothetical protein